MWKTTPKAQVTIAISHQSRHWCCGAYSNSSEDFTLTERSRRRLIGQWSG